MISKGKHKEMVDVWYQYGQAIKRTFGFPENAEIVAQDFTSFARDWNDARANRFIDYVKNEIEMINRMNEYTQ